MEIITSGEVMKQREDFSNQIVEDESGFFEIDYSNEGEGNYSDEDDKGDDFIESANASNFFVQTDESFLKVEDTPQNLNDSAILKVDPKNLIQTVEDQSTVAQLSNPSESQSESLLDKFESFFNSFSNDDDYDEQALDDTAYCKIENRINKGIDLKGENENLDSEEYFCYFLLCPFKIITNSNEMKIGANHLQAIHGIQVGEQKFLSLEEKIALTERQGLKWPIRSCEVSLKNINLNGNSNFPSNYEKADNKTESEKRENEHEKYLLDINQNETFASLWEMHLEKFNDGFTCNRCIDTFSRKNDLRNHQKKYHSNIDTKILSELNSSISEDVDKVPSENHYEKETKKLIITPIENEIQLYTNSIQLSSTNMDIVKNSKDKSTKCDFCEKEYERTGHLRKHTLLHKCEFCNINFSGSKWKKELSSHKKNQHADNENLLYKNDENGDIKMTLHKKEEHGDNDIALHKKDDKFSDSLDLSMQETPQAQSPPKRSRLF